MFIDVEVLTWKKFNPRYDGKKATWFRVDSKIVTSDDLVDFTDSEKWAWIYIMALCCDQNSHKIRINFVAAKKIAHIKTSTLWSCLLKLERNNSLIILRDAQNADGVLTTLQTDRQTDKTNKQGPSDEMFSLALGEFLKIPKTMKGGKAGERYREQIKSPDDHETLLNAIRNYAAFLAWPENSWRSPKSTFETFLGTKRRGEFWRDFITLPERGQPQGDKQTKSVLEIINAGNSR